MNRKQVMAWLKEQEIDVRTISIAVPTDDNGDPCDEDHPEACEDGWFGTCDISGDKGHVYKCTACTKDGEVIDFDAGDWLIGGHLGSIAGCF